ncbi:segregation/condensation protein A [Aliidiomarina halalkaliphila]|uniref:Segregation and condensation protein A n=1 Tax=Aliidiomarina halalkaliphila TaxID=2593535 RepID=A0A552X4W0_9GAMM|nr:segregation/condensation protein A [Aliidiomarina halalkaliphila]TRW50062.1 segregation/condensation protein A [Aliidiomarina halalkaliphila]
MSELASAQQSLPLGFVRGEPVFDQPEDLYIPPEALELMLDLFSGPMDLLLYLIRRQKMDILDLPILKITEQYMQYVDMMRELKLELAADYLLMAAMLAEIKSRMLLPTISDGEDDEEDPRAELVRRLKEYEIIREGANQIDQQPQQERDFFPAHAATDARELAGQAPPDVSLEDLSIALAKVMQLVEVQAHHHIKREALSTRERMSRVLDLLQSHDRVEFSGLFAINEGRSGVVVSFLAILELNKEGLIVLTQAQEFSTIYVSRATPSSKEERA